MSEAPVVVDEQALLRTGRDDALEAALKDLSPAEAQALRWLVRRQRGLGLATEAEFQGWLHAHPAHQMAFNDISSVWQGFDDTPPGDGASRSGLGLDRASVLRSLVPPAGTSGRFPHHSHWLTQALAAGAAFLAVLAWFAHDHWERRSVFSQQYATLRGQQADVKLPDGSVVRLDVLSQLDVKLYPQRREIRLPEGQALFTVRSDAERPFDVMAGGYRITAVGTRFSVRYTPSLGSTQVRIAVAEGRVRVARGGVASGPESALSIRPTPGAAADDLIELTAGQAVDTVGDGRLGPVNRVAANGVAPWRDNRLSFDDTPLSSVLAELERYGNTNLVVSDPAVAAMRVTGSVDLHRIGDFARGLPQVLAVRLQPREGGVEEVVKRR